MSSLAGSFLVARSVLMDPNFSQAVVLLLAHSDEGAYGVVVNRPHQIEGLPFPVFAGGPCPAPGLVMLHGHAEWSENSSDPPEEGDSEADIVAPGVYVGDASCLARVAEPVPGQVLRFRVFSGYAGWGPDQLEGELTAAAWSVVPATSKLLFDTPPEELWDRLAPPAVPQPSLN